MAVIIDEQQQIFHLQTQHTSYIFQVLPTGDLTQLYYGARLTDPVNYQNLGKVEIKDATTGVMAQDQEWQFDVLRQEYSDLGHGDFRQPAYQVEFADGDRITEFKYQRYELQAGKQRLAGLPSTFAEAGDGTQTLQIYLQDAKAQLTLVLNYTIFEQQDVLVKSVQFQNQGSQTVQIRRALSLQLDLPDRDYDLLQFPGAWARERHLVRNPLHAGVQSFGSLRTASSHQHNPFFMLARSQTDNQQGEVYGFNLVYSGNFMDSLEVDQFDTTRVLVGINPEEFSWQLQPQANFQTPEVILTYTQAGFNQMSQQLSTFYQDHLVPQRFAKKVRPILINNWEATYFDFDEKKLLAFVDQAQKLGIELFVLDDGWFQGRNDDTTSLGDWFADKTKLPQGIKHLADAVHQKGLQFGLWFEPEMISLESQLYQEHPDWVIHVPGRQMTPGRHQYVLDFTRSEVVDYLFDAMSQVMTATKLDYVKWDMNRYITELYSPTLAPQQQLEAAHRYTLGVYQLYERLTKAFPEVLFESCASGGGRFDLGMMYYAPQAWTSDDTDALERLWIQYGTSFGYSLSMMGAHVSASPNEQIGRQTSLATRARVAYFGDFGYELDITKMSVEDLATIKEQVAFYKKYRTLFQFGKFYRLQSPYAGNQKQMSWEVVNDDQTLAIVAVYQILKEPQVLNSRVRLAGLKADQRYQINDSSQTYYGDQLMNAGIVLDNLPPKDPDFQARLLMVRAV
ncbi:alpha-galactosidase [Bombilactobacillus folatiphilus]|uniref:Alpha-galactosidase n=1 Tax=Bombilactobacillus folatiphilus TaxID=2923362 RepID=A0ABY4P8Y6_9LACO|nr:alpha-galactosidase [Bombilactobacillus folatiphilus]UQS81999.1 alpha-galactosidase [Bombilactobacillus folatiphilus]